MCMNFRGPWMKIIWTLSARMQTPHRYWTEMALVMLLHDLWHGQDGIVPLSLPNLTSWLLISSTMISFWIDKEDQEWAAGWCVFFLQANLQLVVIGSRDTVLDPYCFKNKLQSWLGRPLHSFMLHTFLPISTLQSSTHHHLCSSHLQIGLLKWVGWLDKFDINKNVWGSIHITNMTKGSMD